MKKLLFLFSILLGISLTLQAQTTYYVATTGADAPGNGTVASPFLTIQYAVDQAMDGDEIVVAAGTYNEQVEIDLDDLTLRGAGPTTTLLVSSATCTNMMNASATAGVRLLGNHSGITLEDFSVSDYDIGLDIGENIANTISDVTIRNVNTSNNCVHGILSEAGDTDGVTIDNVTANNNGSGFFAGRGLWFINGTKANISITNSEFNNNRLVGLDISDGDVTGLTITDNTVTGNGDKGIGVLGPQGPDANLINNNTVTDNGRFGIEIINPSGTTTVSNNTVSRTGSGSDTRDYAGIAVFRRSPGATNADQPSGVAISGNTVTGFVEPSGDGEGFGIVVEGTGMSVTENTVSGNDVGIQVQEGNPTPNTNGTPYFDRGDASVAADVTINNNNIDGNGEGLRAVGTSNVIDATSNWWGDDSGPSGAGPGTGDVVSTGVRFCPWLDGTYPGGAPTSPSGGFATTSTDGHTTLYCSIEEAMFASSGANQEVHVSEGNWAGEVMNRDYSDSPNLTVRAIGATANTVVNGIYLTGASFDGLTFDGLTFTGDAPTPSGFDPGYAVEITNNGNYANLAFVNNVFDGQNVMDAGAIFSNRGFNGFLLDNNKFINYDQSTARPIGSSIANFSLIFTEAQGTATGENYTVTNNMFQNVQHLNAIEAYRWQNVMVSDNMITGTFGRILVWSNATNTPVLNASIERNNIDISVGTTDYQSTGIGAFYLGGDVNILDNVVKGASFCLVTIGIGDLEVLDNELENCDEAGLRFDDFVTGISTTSASITGNTFTDMPTGVENSAQTFELDVCDNTFTNVGQNEFSNPGPFAACGSITIVKEANPAAPWLDFGFDYDLGAFSLDGSNDGNNNVYTASGLSLGNYTIIETDFPGNWDVTGISCDVGDVSIDLDNASVTVTLDQSAQQVTCTFTNERQPQIQITKYNDINANGVEDDGDERIEGWQMFIYEPDGNDGWIQIMPREVRTNANGNANYTALTAGQTYLVCEERRADWGNTDPNDGFDIINGQICQEVPNLQYGENREVVFGNVECNLTVEAGEDKNVCRTKTLQLEGASFSGFATQVTWSVSEQPDNGDAQLIGDNPSATPGEVVFQATVPGTYVLELTVDTQFGCEPISDTVTIEVLNVACGEFPWGGNR